MQKHSHKNNSILILSENEIFNNIVSEKHPFRKLKKLINFTDLIDPYRNLYSDYGQTGIDIEKGFKCLLIQFWEDYSDREMERCVCENMAVRWFCGFSLKEKTPDHTYFCKLRKRLGTKNVADIFNKINDTLRNNGLFGDVFKFINASTIITKTALWEERDKAIKDGEETLNNKNLEKYVADKDARWGAKSKNKKWFGHKLNCCVDTRYGLIDKISVVPANVSDLKAVKNICPKNCMILADKLYDCKEVKNVLRAKNCYNAIIKKKTNKDKIKELDSWHSKLRMPFESTFSKLRKRARYRGSKKVLAQYFFESSCYNLKKKQYEYCLFS